MAYTLYVDRFFVSPYAMSAYVALVEKKLPFELVAIGLDKKEHLQPSYRAPTGRVPALDHDGFWLAESSAICEYLEDQHPTPAIFPKDAKQKAVCREVQAWIRSDLMPIREERSTHTLWYERAKAPLSDKAKAATERLVKGVSAVLKPGATTLFGEWCIADADLGLMLQRLALNGDPLPAGLKAYAEAQWARPSVASWNAKPRPPYVPY